MAVHIDVPQPYETVVLEMRDGAVVRLRRHGRTGGARLALSHGNGLAIDAYYPFWGLLTERYDVVLFDMRNHGRNPLHGASGHDWPTFAADMETIWRGIRAHFGAKPIVGVFHSLSAIASLLHVLELGDRWNALVLFDPPIYPRHGHPLEPVEAEHMREMGARARRRPPCYKDPRGLAFQLAARPEFRRWPPGAHELVARATLRYHPERDEWVLACPRELEAHIFETNVDQSIWPRLPELGVPLKLICGDPDLDHQQPPALIGKAIAEELGVEYQAIPGTSHLLQIEEPEACVRAMESFLARQGLADSG
jgi:pimeloyl-ACP methyl ester carboxylesterase